jgi:prevent-host-death family protein
VFAKRPPWQLQEAKNKFSEVVRLAKSEGPQAVSVRGSVEVYVVSREEYERLNPLTPEPRTLQDLFLNWPMKESGMDLSRNPELFVDRTGYSER